MDPNQQFRPRWNPYKDPSMYDKIDRLEDAVNAILQKLDLGNLESFGKKPPMIEPPKPVEKPPPVKVEELALFQYKPLDRKKHEIRYLEFDTEADILTASMHHLSLDEGKMPTPPDNLDPDYAAKFKEYVQAAAAFAAGQKPTFTALSYTWGEPVMDGTLVLDGKILKITKNLETALNAIWRGGWSAKKWWIDQICINQSDIDERNSQVNLMREIYKKSEEVVVWLGYEGEEGESKRAIETIKEVTRLPYRHQPGNRPREPPKMSVNEVYKNWKALELFFQRPWWERCWVRQEIALNRQVSICYGSRTTSFAELNALFQVFKYTKAMGFAADAGRHISLGVATPQYSQASALQQLKKGTYDGAKFLMLSDLLRHTRSCKSTDAKDKLYSVLGLVDLEEYDITVDYHLSSQQVIRNALSPIWTKENGLPTFGLCQNPNRKNGLPSWAPNLFDEWVREPFPARFNNMLRGSHMPTVHEDTLIVQGVFVDTIDTLCDAVVTSETTDDQLDAVFDAWQQFVDAAKSVLNEKQFWYCRVSLSSEAGEARRASGWLELLSAGSVKNEDEKLSAETGTELDRKYESGLDIPQVKAYLVDPAFTFTAQPNSTKRAICYRYGRGRKIGFTAGGNIGLFPDDIKKGDVLAAIKGAAYLCVLREQEDGSYILVDEAFLPWGGPDFDSETETMSII